MDATGARDPADHQSQQSDGSTELLSARTQGKGAVEFVFIVTYGQTDGVTMLSSVRHMTHKCLCATD